jgi:GT2 family glycosyltransferase
VKARTTVVIVTYRSKGVVDRALDALQPIAEAGGLKCIVVDNASEDGTAEHVGLRYPWVKLLAGSNNIGFGRGCNAGLVQADTEFVLFLNPDAVFDQKGLLLLEGFLDEHPRAGLVAPAIENEAGGFQPVRPLPTPLGILAEEGGFGPSPEIPVWPGSDPFRSEWLCGAALMGRRSLLDELGGFDPHFFLYYEETDLCRRVQETGSEIWVVPSAVARHIGGASAERTDSRLWSGCIAEHYFESRHYYLCKHHGAFRATGAALLEIALMTARSWRSRLRGRPSDRLHYRLKAPILRTPSSLGG